MTYESFLKLNHKYRLISEWDDSLQNTDKTSAFIICTDLKTQIYWKSNDEFGVISYGLEKFKDKLRELDVPYIYQGSGNEHIYYIPFKYFDKCIDIFEPKHSPKNSVSPFSIRNITYWLRFCRNFDKQYYQNKLKNYLEQQGK